MPKAPESLDGSETASACSLSSRGRKVHVDRRKALGRFNKLILLLALAMGGALLLRAPSTACEVRLPRARVPDWTARHRLPLLVAAVTFSCLTVSGMVSLLILQNMRSFRDKWSHQVQEGLRVHLFISLTGVLTYGSMYVSEKQFVVDTLDGGGHLIMRNVHWAVCSPLQWYIFSLSLTMARRGDMVRVYAATLAVNVFGLLMLSMPTWPSFLFCFGAACAAFGAMFWQVLRLPLLPEASGLARRICWVQLLLWSGYPLATYGRHAGLISEWVEQVLLYTLLDSATKCVTFSSVIISRCLLTLASLNSTIEFVLAANDLVLVLDEGFRLLDCPHGGASVQGYFDLKSPKQGTLLDRCTSGEHRGRILSAAMIADMQPEGVPAPKCIVAFALRGGGGACGGGGQEVLAECSVSRASQGRRRVELAVTSVRSRHPSRAPSASQLLPATSASRSLAYGGAAKVPAAAAAGAVAALLQGGSGAPGSELRSPSLAGDL